MEVKKNPFVALEKLSQSTIKKYSTKTKNINRQNLNLRKQLLTTSRKCYFCGLGFKHENFHMCTHTKEKHLKCLLCKKNFHHPYKKNQHVNSVHKSNGYFKCPECSYKSETTQRILLHLTVHRNESAFQCPLCPKSYRQQRGLQYHTQQSHDPKGPLTVKCPKCPRQFHPMSLKTHIQTVHEKLKPHSCTFCPKEFRQRGNLKSHMKGIHLREKDLTKCPHSKCKEVFQSKQRARTHALKCPLKDPNKEIGFRCKLCNKLFAIKVKLRMHVAAVHKEEKTFKCEQAGCGKTFTCKSYLTGHLWYHRVKDSDSGNTSTCSECKKTYATPKGLRRHLREFHPIGGRIRYPCYFCGEDFGARSATAGHLRVHTKEKPFKCAFASSGCDLNFGSATARNHHKVRCRFGNSNKANFKHKCGMCQRSFLWKNCLERHIASHTGEKAYKCDGAVCGCGTAFSSKSCLSAHIKLRRRKGPTFPCDKCDKVCRTSHTLRKHLRLHMTTKAKFTLFGCYFCGKCLCSAFALRSHLGLHTKERPFKCPDCLESFQSFKTWKYHLQTRH